MLGARAGVLVTRGGTRDEPMADGCSRAAAVPGLALCLTSETQRVAEARRAVEALAAELGMDPRGAGEVGLCVNEALANVICHAYQGQAGRPIELRAWGAAGEMVVEIRDWGNGVNPDDHPRPREHDPLTPGGLGLICLRGFMDRVVYTPQPDGMLLSMAKRLPGRGESASCC